MAASTETHTLFPRLELRGWHGAVLGLLAIVIFAVLAFVLFQPIQVLPRIRLAPGYALLDQSGERLSNEDLRGRFVLYNFTRSACVVPGCTQYDLITRQVQARLDEADLRGQSVSFVTISIDEKDTPAALAAYARSLDADVSDWHFLSGDPARIKAIVGGGFEVYYERQVDGSYTFSPTMILVDGWGIIRQIYHTRSTPPDADRILRHLGVLAEEVANSKGAARLGYEAAHLFLCYAS